MVSTLFFIFLVRSLIKTLKGNDTFISLLLELIGSVEKFKKEVTEEIGTYAPLSAVAPFESKKGKQEDSFCVSLLHCERKTKNHNF